MAMKRCPICGEKYSETYRDCPFCEEEEALREGEEIRRNTRRGKRTAQGGRRFSLITPTLIVLIVIMAALLIYLLRGNDAEDNRDSTDPSQTEEMQGDSQTQEPEDGSQTQEPDDGQSGVMPEDGDSNADTPSVPVQDDEPAESDYETAAKLPDGLSLSTTDFTLKSLGETHTIRASGGSSTYQWISQDDGIASVDQNGKVTAVSGGTTNVLVTDGSKKAICIVRVSAPAGSTGTTETTTTTPSGGGSLKVGSAVVINGGNGVRVRSGPGTNYEALATVPNGASIQIVEDAGNGWYKITFSDVGGASTPGYMKGEFLQNS